MGKWKQFICGLTGHWWDLLTVDLGVVRDAKLGRCNFCGKKKVFKEYSSTDELMNYLKIKK
jgi:hypothetical protein